jgi:SnoaL-like domain
MSPALAPDLWTGDQPLSHSPHQRRRAVSAELAPDEVVRKFFDCYTEGRPQDFDRVVTPDYMDYGHTPPGRGPDGARDDYNNAVKLAGGLIRYTIDALVVDDDIVAAAWTGTLPNGADMKGLSLYRTSGGLISSTRHTLIGELPL